MNETSAYLKFRERVDNYGLILTPRQKRSPEQHLANSKPIEIALFQTLQEYPALFDPDLMKILMYSERAIEQMSKGNWKAAYGTSNFRFGPSSQEATLIREYLNLIATSNEDGIKRATLKDVLRKVFNIDENLEIKVSNLETSGLGFVQSDSNIFYLDQEGLDSVIRPRHSPAFVTFRENSDGCE